MWLQALRTVLFPVHSLKLVLAALLLAGCLDLPCRGLAAEPTRTSEDTVVATASADAAAPTKWTGEILDYTGRELRLRLTTGRERVFPATRVVSVATERCAEQQAGDAAFAQQDFRRALAQYRLALEGSRESRDWVRREILANIVWCYRNLDQWEPACDQFLSLLIGDRTTQFFDVIPLRWTPAEPTAGLEKKAKAWLGPGEAPAAVLLAASHLLSTNERAACVASLTRLAKDRDPRIAALATAQLWRTQAFNADEQQTTAWLKTLDSMPEPLRAGAYFTLGGALAARHPQQAALLLLHVPVLYPRERALSAAALLAAGKALDKAGESPDTADRKSDAARVYRELLGEFPKSPAAAEARQRLGKAAATPSRAQPPATAAADSLADRFLAGLRGRQLFALAVEECHNRLAEPDVAQARRAALVIELLRTLAEQALAAPPERRDPVWKEAVKVGDDFFRRHAQNPRLLLVRMQAALTVLAQGEMARQEAEIGSSGAAAENIRAVLRAAIAQLKQVEDDLAVELRRRNRPTGPVAGLLSENELVSLQANVRFQLARGFRNQALTYRPGSPDRINALTQALELLAPLALAPVEEPLAWPSRVDVVVGRRLLGDNTGAQKAIAAIEKAGPPPAVGRQLTAQRVRILLAEGHPEEALAAAGAPQAVGDAPAADLDFARLEALVALWKRAGEGRPSDEAQQREMQQCEEKATAAVRHIEASYGEFWTRRAETLLAGTLSQATQAASMETLTRVAVSFYRGGQIDEALKAYDQAARQAASKDMPQQAFDIGYTAAAIEHQRKHYRQASERFAQVACALSTHPKAAGAHLAAIYDAAEAAQQDKPPDLKEYRRLLQEHRALWPQDASNGLVAWWLGRLHESDRDWAAAIAAFKEVPVDDPHYAEAMQAALAAYESLLAFERAAGKPDEAIAREALEFVEQINKSPGGKAPQDRTLLERQMTLSAARIWLGEVPEGARQAEELLARALADAGDAPAQWLASAQMLQLTALAAQGRIDEANKVLERISGAAPAEWLAMLIALDRAGANLDPAMGRPLATLELQAIAALGGRAGKLSVDERRRLARIEAEALLVTGDHKAALPAFENLVKQEPHDQQLHERLATLLVESGQPEALHRALEQWRIVIKRSKADTPRWYQAHLGMARAQLALGNKSQARTIVKVVEATQPDFGGEALRKEFLEVLSAAQ